MSKGVIYICWGEYDKDELERSIETIKKIPLPYVVRHVDKTNGLHNKSKMYDLSPFDTTLFLDSDTVVLDNIHLGFEKADIHGMSLCICEAPDSRRFEGLKHLSYMIEYNSGVIFFKKCPEVKEVFDKWKELCLTVDDRCYFFGKDGKKYVSPHNDQAALALAISSCQYNPAVLPLNFNFRPEFMKNWFGRIKIWHSHTTCPASFIDGNNNLECFTGASLNS